MKRIILYSFVLALIFTACENGEDSNIAQPKATYSIAKIVYTLGDGDGSSFVIHNLDPIVFYNRNGSLMNASYKDAHYTNFSITSRFILSESLPDGIDVSQLTVSTPSTVAGDKVYAVNNGWLFTNNEQSRPYGSESVITQTIKVSPMSKATISRSYEEEILQTSFVATLENNLTGEQISVKGKWQGTVDHNNFNTVLKEERLN